MRGDERLPVLTWLRLARVYQCIDHASAAHLRQFGLSVAQFDVLAQIGAREGLTQQELADALFVTKGNVTQLLDKLEQRGLIERRPAGRSNCLHLTPAGRALVARAIPAQERLIASLFASLAPAEQAKLLALLRRLCRRLG